MSATEDAPNESLGSYLRDERELRQISLAELAHTTRIPVRFLERLEQGSREGLPADVYVRGYLKAYARALGIDEAHVLTRYGAGEPEEDTLTTLPGVYAPVSRRNFGTAIALVILLILFTLALSIVLRPRHRNAPIELSEWHEVTAAASGTHLTSLELRGESPLNGGRYATIGSPGDGSLGLG